MITTTLLVSAESSPTANSEQGADRLDRWLALQLPEHSRTAIQRWIKEGNVFVNDRPGRANMRLMTGDEIRLDLPETLRPSPLAPQAIPIDIIFEDQDIVVVNKAAGLVVHPAPGHLDGTLVNAVLHHVPSLGGIGGEIRPGIVHRLDKDTSGVIVIAKNEAALRNLQAQFKGRKVTKHYIALVEGKIDGDSGRVVAQIGRDPRDRKRMAVISSEQPSASNSTRTSRPATTEFTVTARFVVPVHNDQGRGSFTLVEAHPITGRTHQIRVHFMWLGHPLVGDPIYGLKRQRLPVPRLFLHARRLAFQLPSTGEWKEFVAPIPHDLQEVLDRLDHASVG